MGFTTGEAQCLIAPPYAFAAIIMYGCGWLGDKKKIRGPIIIFNMILCLVGLPIMGFAKSPAVRYFGVFLTTAGANSNVPATMSYQANNIRGQWKRAFCSAHAYKSCGTKSTLPLATDIVRLIRHRRRNIAVSTCGGQEDAKVSDCRRLGKTHDRETDQAEDHVEDDNGSTDLLLVTKPSAAVHDDGGKCIGGCDKTLCFTGGEAHVALENDREEISQRIRDGCGVKKDLRGSVQRSLAASEPTYHSVAPDFEVHSTPEEFPGVPRLRLSIATISIDTSDNEFGFALGQELPRCVRLVREIDQEPVCGDTKKAGQSTFNNEDPGIC